MHRILIVLRFFDSSKISEFFSWLVSFSKRVKPELGSRIRVEKLRIKPPAAILKTSLGHFIEFFINSFIENHHFRIL